MDPKRNLRRPSLSRKGYSILESLVVIVILVLMMWILIPGMFKKTEAQKAEEAYLEKLKERKKLIEEREDSPIGVSDLELPDLGLPPEVFDPNNPSDPEDPSGLVEPPVPEDPLDPGALDPSGDPEIPFSPPIEGDTDPIIPPSPEIY